MRAAMLLVFMLVGMAVSAQADEKRGLVDVVGRLKERAKSILGKLKDVDKDKLQDKIDLAVKALKGFVSDDGNVDKCTEKCSSLLKRFAPACDDLCLAAFASAKKKINS